MSIDFSEERWSEVTEAHAKWWAGELDRPLIQLRVRGRDPRREEASLPCYGFTAAYGLEPRPEDIIDAWDYMLSSREYLGDAFPFVWPNFGAGAAAAFLGAKLEARPETVWFHPVEEQEIADIRFAFDAENVWLQRVKALCRAACERWEGLVQVAMSDLGGNLDILSSFRPGEKLLLDLYDHPDEVKRLTWEAHEAWWQCFDDINAVLKPVNRGYTAWTPIYSEDPYYMLQCDFCYMIGPDMFDEFVKPELAATCKRLTNPFYHLDGPGQIPHLPSLLEIEELKGVQWIPGDGSPPMSEWPDIYRTINGGGKLIQVFDHGGLQVLDALADQLGDVKGIVAIVDIGPEHRDAGLELLRKYNVPV